MDKMDYMYMSLVFLFIAIGLLIEFYGYRKGIIWKKLLIKKYSKK